MVLVQAYADNGTTIRRKERDEFYIKRYARRYSDNKLQLHKIIRGYLLHNSGLREGVTYTNMDIAREAFDLLDKLYFYAYMDLKNRETKRKKKRK